MDAESGGAKLDLYLAFIDRDGDLHVRAQFNPDLFEEQVVRQIIKDFEALVYAAAARPQSPLSELRAAEPEFPFN